MGAALVVMRRRGINPMENGLALWMGINLVITFVLPGLSIGGHLGGLAGGALAAAADLRGGRAQPQRAASSGWACWPCWWRTMRRPSAQS